MQKRPARTYIIKSELFCLNQGFGFRVILFQILSTYDLREGALTACINFAQEQVSKATEANNPSARRQAQMHVSVVFEMDTVIPLTLVPLQLRLYKNEMSVEEVIRERTQTICYEKCRDHFPDMKFKKVL